MAIRDLRYRCPCTEDASVRRRSQELTRLSVRCSSVLDDRSEPRNRILPIASRSRLQVGHLYTEVVRGVRPDILENRSLPADLGDEPRCDKRTACHRE
jgi:hypothetical protein